MTNDERISYLEELVQIAYNGYAEYKPFFDKLNDAYLLVLESELYNSLKERNKSKNYIPKLNSKAKRIYDGLTETYFNNDTFAKLEPYINSSHDVIDKWQEALNFYCDKINLYKIFSPIFLKAAFSPSSVVKVFWGKDEAKIEEIDINDIYFDPDAKNTDDIRYIVHRIYLTINDIKKLIKNKTFKQIDLSENRPYERICLNEIYELNDDKWSVSTLYNSELLRDKVELKDGQPFIFGYMLPQTKRNTDKMFVCAYGEPALSSLLPLQDELNAIRNSITDVTRNQATPKIIFNRSASISRADLERPSGAIFTDSPADIKIVPPGDINASMATLQVIEQEMSEVSGVSPQQNGAPTTRQETATMASIMANEGSVRLQGYIRTYNETFFEPIFERLAFLVWKYGNPLFFAGFNRGEVPSFNINLNTGIGALNKEVQKKSLMDASGIISAQFGMCLQLQDADGANRMKEANEKILLELLPLYGIKDPENFIGKESELAKQLKSQAILPGVASLDAEAGVLPADAMPSV